MATATSLPARNPKTQTAIPGAKNALDRDRNNRRIREAVSLLGQAGDATRRQPPPAQRAASAGAGRGGAPRLRVRRPGGADPP